MRCMAKWKQWVKSHSFLHQCAKTAKRIISCLAAALTRTCMLAFRCFRLQQDKVVISNYYGKGYGDNGKYIAEELHQRDPALRIYWISKQTSGFPDFIQVVSTGSIAALYHLATAGAWIDNCRKFSYILKRKKQYYIQTWHGSIALKRVEKDAEEHLEKRYIKSAVHDSKMADLMLSNSTFCTEMYRRAFWYDGEILECGSPRADILFCATEAQKCAVKQALGVSVEKRLVLYAPTFRADYNTDCYSLDFDNILELLQKTTGADWAFAVRLHPNVSAKADFITYSDTVVYATAYPDMYERLAAAEILITDYSSCMFEAGFANKPVFLFATDIDSYAKDRNFYFNLEELPYPVARTNEELLQQITSYDRTAYKQALQVFHALLGLKENGNASRLAAEKILEVLEKN